MRRGVRAFAVYLAALAGVVAFMAANSLVVAGSDIPSRLGAAIRSPEVTGRSAGAVPPTRMARAIELRW
jgi:hypothetical protein